jgi:RHH-type proline utilization regulon transcriptional repressor/proline dehydrogenase/delta 1-pyrroline-5-carboxylate dehydrogenase
VVAQVTKPDYEAKTLAIANALLMATREKKNLFAQMRDQMRWDDKIMDFAMGNPGLKVQLFRFIDALPALRSKPEIARHLQEYLSADEVELPSVLKGCSTSPTPTRPPASWPPPPSPLLLKPWPTATFPAKRWTRRSKPSSACVRTSSAFTMDLLGEAVITEEEAQAYLQRYLDLMEQLSNAAKNWKTVEAIDVAGGKELPRFRCP